MVEPNPRPRVDDSSMAEQRTQINTKTQPFDIHQRRLHKHAHEIFSQDVENVEALISSTETGNVTQRLATDRDTMQDIVKEGKSEAQQVFYIIRQKNTFSRLLITQMGIQIILEGHRVFTPFFDALTAFGFKRDDDHRVWDSFYSSGLDGNETNSVIELCYVVRYVERNNRSPKNPWSLRQTGIYQQTILHQQNSTWILLQPSQNLYDDLKEKLYGRPTGSDTPIRSSYLLHLDFLSSMASNWGEYIEYLWAEMDKVDDKACNSEIRLGKRNDYDVSFSDCQKLQRRRRILLRTMSVLESCLTLAKDLENLHWKLRSSNVVEDNRFVDGIRIYKAQIHMHQRNLRFMMEYIRGTTYMLSDILNSRSDEMTLKTSQTMQESLALNQNDSRILKLLSIIATIYLPASLMATLFSSNLIELKQGNEGRGHFQAVPGFWLYIVVTSILTVVTFGLAAVVIKGRYTCLKKNTELV
ncbi:uncharacterized protein BDZ99DRAFT_463282 [Mytilinidion resinicola]|uniref:CorA-like transporter domain-containing protein n=1 Tax=Mytilinidion resinicola TaxID=574789 RepID=A0A6A6YL21_9PEZI|nr:uncharacterized protein BDZ99DRAFT_463282 [Mytilinidion resinicola]KAF2809500.1 hypothetical protein BDZ99DRAFT_463282 [Mytilinidion resinicola]